MGADISMFNEEQKLEYIKYEQNNSAALEGLFKRIAKNEEMYKKDVADMNFDELIAAISSLNMHREDYRAQRISLLRAYIRWAIRYGKSSNDSPIFKITAESINSKDAIRSNMIQSPEALENILNIAIMEDTNSLDRIDRSKQPNRSTRDKLVFWLLYSGIPLEEIVTLKKKDIDINAKTVLSANGFRYEIDVRVLPLWSACASADYIEKRNGKVTGKGKTDSKDIIHQQLQENEYLFRANKGKDVIRTDGSLKNEYLSLNTHRKTVVSIYDSYNAVTKQSIKIPPDNVRLSGMFYRLYMLECAGKEITSVELETHLKNINISSNPNVQFNFRKWRIAYEDWKLAFNYM